MARRSPRVIDTKQRILDAALALFGERGYYNVAVDEIAARAGVTKGALYYYFTDTADLARDLARQLWDRLQADARKAFDREQDAITNLKRGFDTFLDRLQHLP
jgi:AcrR family transcriptional regulator